MPNHRKLNLKPNSVHQSHRWCTDDIQHNTSVSGKHQVCQNKTKTAFAQNTHAKIITCNITALISIHSPVLLRIVNRLSITRNKNQLCVLLAMSLSLKIASSYASMEQLKWFETCWENYCCC